MRSYNIYYICCLWVWPSLPSLHVATMMIISLPRKVRGSLGAYLLQPMQPARCLLLRDVQLNQRLI